MRTFFQRLASICFVAGGWALAILRTVLDGIGYSTTPDDVDVAVSRLDDFLTWLLDLPWWLPWSFATIATVVLMWVSWPRTSFNAQNSELKAPATEPLLSNVVLQTPMAPLAWRSAITCSRRVTNVEIRLEVMEAVGGVGIGREWEDWKVYPLTHRSCVAAKETLGINVCVPHQMDGHTFWFWAVEGWEEDKSRLAITSPTYARCRLIVSHDGGKEEGFNFVALDRDPIQTAQKPLLIGENLFEKYSKW